MTNDPYQIAAAIVRRRADGRRPFPLRGVVIATMLTLCAVFWIVVGLVVTR
jgi:hypothetical protein